MNKILVYEPEIVIAVFIYFSPSKLSTVVMISYLISCALIGYPLVALPAIDNLFRRRTVSSMFQNNEH